MGQDKYVAYVGTYTHGSSIGIHVYDLDVEEGHMKEREVVPVNNASHITKSNNGKYLYSIADEGVEPPRDFKFFYKEHVDNKAKMEMWMGGQKRSIDVPFYITRDSLKGQLYNADELMKDFYGKADCAREYSGFMGQLSIFTRWYSWQSGINNRFGNFIPEA